MVRFGDITAAELSAITEKYPWFSAGKALLCRRMAVSSGMDVADGLFRDSLMYFPDAAYVSSVLRDTIVKDYSDADLSAAIREVIEENPREVYDGMDFFSRREYEKVKRDGDASFGKIAIVDYSVPAPELAPKHDDSLCPVSETLAEIFADQGYPDRAIEIYRTLSLQSPEKSAYFASLIEKLKN